MTPWQEVRALAEKATSGVWEWWTSNSTKRISIQNGGDGRVLRAYVARDGLADISVSDEDAALIVAAVNLIRDPAFIGMMEDAARYRFLRDNAGMGFQMVMQERREPDEWDAEIDEAMRGRENAD
jgi:hypothetical protein